MTQSVKLLVEMFICYDRVLGQAPNAPTLDLALCYCFWETADNVSQIIGFLPLRDSDGVPGFWYSLILYLLWSYCGVAGVRRQMNQQVHNLSLPLPFENK